MASGGRMQAQADALGTWGNPNPASRSPGDPPGRRAWEGDGRIDLRRHAPEPTWARPWGAARSDLPPAQTTCAAGVCGACTVLHLHLCACSSGRGATASKAAIQLWMRDSACTACAVWPTPRACCRTMWPGAGASAWRPGCSTRPLILTLRWRLRASWRRVRLLTLGLCLGCVVWSRIAQLNRPHRPRALESACEPEQGAPENPGV